MTKLSCPEQKCFKESSHVKPRFLKDRAQYQQMVKFVGKIKDTRKRGWTMALGFPLIIFFSHGSSVENLNYHRHTPFALPG